MESNFWKDDIDVVKVLVAASMLFFCFWDVYSIFFGKVFDIIGVAILIFSTVLFVEKLYVTYWELLFVGFILIFAIIGFFLGGVTASIAVVMGCFTFTICRGLRFRRNVKYNILLFLLMFIIVCQFFQFFYFKIFNTSIIFYPLEWFNPPRNYDGLFFRASGFMAEGNALASTVILIFLGIVSNRKPTIALVILVCFSLLISKSVFGIIMVPIILLLSGTFSMRQLLLVAILFVPLVIYKFDFSIVVNRLENFGNDPSFNARLGLESIPKHYWNLLIPNGFSTEPDDVIAVNGWVFLLDALGVFIIPLILITKKILNIRTLLLLLFLFVSYQMLTMQIFWAVIGLCNFDRCENVRSPQSAFI